MKNSILHILAFVIVLVVIKSTGNIVILDLGNQGQQTQERTMGIENSVDIDGLPRSVQETLKEDYEDWSPVEAIIDSDPVEGTFYKVKLEKAAEGETKTVKIALDGKVIDEEEGGQENKRPRNSSGVRIWKV
jgi:hypothetical protein